MAEALLEVDALRAGWGDAVVLRDVSFRLEQGEVLALLGRNGAGKTTLIAALMGVARHRGGTLRLRGEAIERLPPEARAARGLGWVPQERNVFRSLTVEENLTAVARPGPWDLARLYGLFPRLAERRRNLGADLSGGEQQMLAVARALALNPALLLLDEPTEGLAPVLARGLLDAIRRVTREEGIAAILVEQHAGRILKLTDRTAFLAQGSLVALHPSDAVNDALLDRHLALGAH